MHKMERLVERLEKVAAMVDAGDAVPAGEGAAVCREAAAALSSLTEQLEESRTDTERYVTTQMRERRDALAEQVKALEEARAAADAYIDRLAMQSRSPNWRPASMKGNANR